MAQPRPPRCFQQWRLWAAAAAALALLLLAAARSLPQQRSRSLLEAGAAAAAGGGSQAAGGPLQEARAMVIVEPRAHPRLCAVLANFDALVPPAYDLYVFHGPAATDHARKCSAPVAARRRVVLLPLDTGSLDADGYNALLRSPSFWQRINAELVLVFQTDTVLCGASQWSIANFEHLDYIG